MRPIAPLRGADKRVVVHRYLAVTWTSAICAWNSSCGIDAVVAEIGDPHEDRGAVVAAEIEGRRFPWRCDPVRRPDHPTRRDPDAKRRSRRSWPTSRSSATGRSSLSSAVDVVEREHDADSRLEAAERRLL